MGEATAAAAAAAAGEADAAPRHTEKGAFFFFLQFHLHFSRNGNEQLNQAHGGRNISDRSIQPKQINKEKNRWLGNQEDQAFVAPVRTWQRCRASLSNGGLPPPFDLAWVLANKLILLLLDRSTRFSRVRAVCFLAARHKQINPTSSPR